MHEDPVKKLSSMCGHRYKCEPNRSGGEVDRAINLLHLFSSELLQIQICVVLDFLFPTTNIETAIESSLFVGVIGADRWRALISILLLSIACS